MEREYLKEFVCSETIIPSENEEIKKEKFIKKNSWKIELKFSNEKQKKRKLEKKNFYFCITQISSVQSFRKKVKQRERGIKKRKRKGKKRKLGRKENGFRGRESIRLIKRS